MAMTALAGASASFAHLLGISSKAAKKAEDNERDRRDDETEEEWKDRLKKLDEAEEDDDAKAKSAEGDEPQDVDKPKDSDIVEAKGKDAAAEDDDDDKGDDKSDEDDTRKKGTRSARLRERARCAAIFADSAAGKNPALAAQLAFGTNLPRTQAVAVLRAGGLAVPVARNRLDERMAAVKVPVIGAIDPALSGNGMSFADRVVLAGKKRRGEA